ncbi:MAG: 30S ribosomal protein S5 [Crocinitomicaceae bacterium]|jgi:small subunit ribosomal protein S5|nr:30S ribosomal protein S5 [Crocinitomicaceae bacterium]MBH19454.1 30S ribosomal protein S5 [Crocinitomicaceae bacterium]RPG81493.1 MAG: 30S ribosomal protein S5 [Crocinitomicaceae bacterium TMED135]|tara:strand:+ start:5201 stop:5716 length:516 start_codon:yes stop_codon:yes gene_type:complete
MIESEKSVRATDIELKDRLVAINRVTKVTKGGRHFSFSAIVVVGDEKSIVGHGLGKANEVTEAISKAVEDAKKNLRRVAVVNDTLPHSIKSKFSGAQVFLKPASAGTGVIAGGAMRAVLESAGIKNVLAKSQGSSNPHNVVKATVNALLSLRDANSVAQQRGISLDKVFNG